MLGFAIKVFLALGAVCYLAILLLSQSFYSVFSPNDTVLVAFASESYVQRTFFKVQSSPSQQKMRQKNQHTENRTKGKLKCTLCQGQNKK